MSTKDMLRSRGTGLRTSEGSWRMHRKRQPLTALSLASPRVRAGTVAAIRCVMTTGHGAEMAQTCHSPCDPSYLSFNSSTQTLKSG
jgi:hypothetical protein